MATPKSKEALDYEKQRAAKEALKWVPNGTYIGLGSGSTVAHFIALLGEAMRRGELQVEAVVAASLDSEARAKAAGIPLRQPERGLRLSLTIDGADEISPSLQLIKGGGGALLREKLIATASEQLLIISDSSKPVAQLGKFPLPLEVVPFALPWVLDTLTGMNANPAVRMNKAQPTENARTDQGNYLVDCSFGAISDPAALASRLQRLTGIVEHGLFLGMTTAALVANGEEVAVLRPA